jgi:hypothetical protein
MRQQAPNLRGRDPAHAGWLSCWPHARRTSFVSDWLGVASMAGLLLNFTTLPIGHTHVDSHALLVDAWHVRWPCLRMRGRWAGVGGTPPATQPPRCYMYCNCGSGKASDLPPTRDRKAVPRSQSKWTSFEGGAYGAAGAGMALAVASTSEAYVGEAGAAKKSLHPTSPSVGDVVWSHL